MIEKFPEKLCIVHTLSLLVPRAPSEPEKSPADDDGRRPLVNDGKIMKDFFDNFLTLCIM